MLILTKPVEAELEISKSTFIAHLAPCKNRQAAMDLLAKIREQHPQASHYCWALHTPSESGMSDDGEPSGTAGRPIFNLLQHKQLSHLIAIVVRYYGGIKLGTGGLARAYSQAVKHALETADLKPYIPQSTLILEASFATESKIRRYCQQHPSIIIAAANYHDRLSLTLHLPAAEQSHHQMQLHQLLQGQINFATP